MDPELGPIEITFELMFDSGEVAITTIKSFVDLSLDGNLQGEAREAALLFMRQYWPEDSDTRQDWEIIPFYQDKDGEETVLETFFFTELEVE